MEFLRKKGVPLQERICPDDVSDVVPQVSVIDGILYGLLHGKKNLHDYLFAPVRKASFCSLNVD